MFCYRSAPNLVRVFGWLDVHETTDEWRRIEMRICLDHNYVQFADCQTLVREGCTNLEISDDSYAATFISPQKNKFRMTRDAITSSFHTDHHIHQTTTHGMTETAFHHWTSFLERQLLVWFSKRFPIATAELTNLIVRD